MVSGESKYAYCSLGLFAAPLTSFRGYHDPE